MENLNERAANYAAEKTNELLAKAIAQAYEDGYRDGYKDRDDAIKRSILNSDIEFVDLGLPSGTMWAMNFLKKDNNVSYLPYKDADLIQLILGVAAGEYDEAHLLAWLQHHIE